MSLGNMPLLGMASLSLFSILRRMEHSLVCFCLAYPKGIPQEIAYGNDKHLELWGDEAIPIIFTREEKTD